jgi:hypothetical protein
VVVLASTEDSVSNVNFDLFAPVTPEIVYLVDKQQRDYSVDSYGRVVFVGKSNNVYSVERYVRIRTVEKENRYVKATG